LCRGLVINCTHDHIIRLLPPFIIRRRDVTEFLDKFETVLARASKSALKLPPDAPKKQPRAETMALAATR
jgi:hypothetical protein